MTNPQYQQKKSFYQKLLTLYGRNVVLEILEQAEIEVFRLHLATSNRKEANIERMIKLAELRKAEIVYHDKKALSRISRNAKQDQGVAIDIIAPDYIPADEISNSLGKSYRLLALDGIQNPQNLGMIIRSAAAGNIDGIILPRDNSAKISPLVVKASAGCLFKIKIFHCEQLAPVLQQLQANNSHIIALSSYAKTDIYNYQRSAKEVFILGNEHQGVSASFKKMIDEKLKIPMNRGVESLNVAISAALIAYMR